MQKQYTIDAQFLLKSNRKSYALYRMVVTDDLGWPLTTPISTLCVAFRIFLLGEGRDFKLGPYKRKSQSIFLDSHTLTHTTVLRLCGICPGKPGWAGTRI